MWSRLEGTSIWEAAEEAYSSPAGREYHNMKHVMRLYEVAEQKDLEYSTALDLAILAHDVIYDERPKKEQRSAEWLIKEASGAFTFKQIRDAAALIHTTIDHTPSPDNRLVLLDLHDLKDVERSLENRELIISEMENLYGLSKDEIRTKNHEFMTALVQRIEERLDRVSEEDRRGFMIITNGIRAVFGDAERPSMNP